MAVLKVSSSSSPSAAAGALANTIRDQGWAEIQVIGPKAVNQAIKAIAIARGYIAPSGIDLIAVPSFVEVEIEGQEKTAIKLEIRPRNPVAKFAPPVEPVGTAAEEEVVLPPLQEPSLEPEPELEEPSEGEEPEEPPSMFF